MLGPRLSRLMVIMIMTMVMVMRTMLMIAGDVNAPVCWVGADLKAGSTIVASPSFLLSSLSWLS